METITYDLISRQDLRRGIGTWQSRLQDGSLATLDEIDAFFPGTDFSTFAALPSAARAGRIWRRTDGVRGLWVAQGSNWYSLAHEAVNVKEFGAKGDGVTDDTAALQTALDLGGTVILAPGTYLISSTLVMSVEGTRLLGISETGSILRTTGAIDALRVSANRCKLENLFVSGNSVGSRGIILHNSARSILYNVRVRNFTSHGVVFDISATTPTGNNNFTKFIGGLYANNGGSGIAVPTIQTDNNAIELLGVDCSSNGSHALLFKGQGLRVWGGVYQGSTGYGIQISEAGDGSNSTNCILIFPWLEGNSSGGYRGGGKSTRNVLWNVSGQQSLSNAAGSNDVEIFSTTIGSGAAGMRQGDADAWVFHQTVAALDGTNKGIDVVAAGAGADVPMRIRTTGTGPLYLSALSNGPELGASGAWKLRGSQTFTNLDTTPSVSTGNHFKATNSGATSITTFDDGGNGQTITVTATNGNTTLVNGATLKLAGAANYVMTADDTWTGLYDGSVWRETGRSVN